MSRQTAVTVLYRESGSGCDEGPARSGSGGSPGFNAFELRLVSYPQLTFCLRRAACISRRTGTPVCESRNETAPQPSNAAELWLLSVGGGEAS